LLHRLRLGDTGHGVDVRPVSVTLNFFPAMSCPYVTRFEGSPLAVMTASLTDN
jgi:hypothetical protein